MHKMTADNLRAAFAGECQAQMRYLAFASRAEREGHANVARLLRAIAYAEKVHAVNYLAELRHIGRTANNLGAALEGEAFEIDEMYPAYIAVATLQGEKGAERNAHYALEAEKIHAVLLAGAHEAVLAGQDATKSEIRVCPVCGHTVVGSAPEDCPVCGTAGRLFHAF